ncbi:EamA family transporter [Paenibacillus sp. y28]|uniref:EamA family transporter n=1 Tax=Paenibacillus sp. y28 TaxID=3129110 RepID=UPI00301600A8
MLYVLPDACSYGVLSTFIKQAYDEGFRAGQVSGSQMLFVLLLMWLLALWQQARRTSGPVTPIGRTAHGGQTAPGANRFGRPLWKDMIALLAAGLPMGLTSLFYYGSLQYVPASLVMILLFQFVWIGVLLDALLSRKRPGGRQMLAVAALFTGTVLAAGQSEMLCLPWPGIGLGLFLFTSYFNSHSRSGITCPEATFFVGFNKFCGYQIP